MIFILNFNSSRAQENINNNVDSSVVYLINEKLNKPFIKSGYFLYEDTIFNRSTRNLDEYRKNPNWEYDFSEVLREGIDIFDSISYSFDRFALRYSKDSINGNIDFSIDGFVYNNKVFVNQRKYCVQRLGGQAIPSLYMEQDFDSLLYLLKLKYGFKYKLNPRYSTFSLYEIKIPNFSKQNLYWLSSEIVPKLNKYDSENYKSTGSALVSEKAYVEVEKCNCIDYNLVTLIRSRQPAPYKFKEKTYMFNSFEYLLIRNKDLEIIEKGIFSFEKRPFLIK